MPFTSIAAVQGRQERKERGGKKVDSPAETSFSLKSDAHYTLLTDNPMSPLQALMHIIKYSNIKN